MPATINTSDVPLIMNKSKDYKSKSVNVKKYDSKRMYKNERRKDRTTKQNSFVGCSVCDKLLLQKLKEEEFLAMLDLEYEEEECMLSEMITTITMDYLRKI